MAWRTLYGCLRSAVTLSFSGIRGEIPKMKIRTTNCQDLCGLEFSAEREIHV